MPRIDGAESLGLLLRTAAALGFDGVVVGGGPHPYSRRVARVSMGGVWHIPLLHLEDSDQLQHAVRQWQDAGGYMIAAALSQQAMPLRDWQPDVGRSLGLVLGPEAYGLEQMWLEACDQQLYVPMHGTMDSLNVAVAGGIFMYHLFGLSADCTD